MLRCLSIFALLVAAGCTTDDVIAMVGATAGGAMAGLGGPTYSPSRSTSSSAYHQPYVSNLTTVTGASPGYSHGGRVCGSSTRPNACAEGD